MSTGPGLNKWPIIPDVSLANGGRRQRWRLKHALVHFSWSCTSQFLLPCMEVQTGWRHACAILSVFKPPWFTAQRYPYYTEGDAATAWKDQTFCVKLRKGFAWRTTPICLGGYCSEFQALSASIYSPHVTADFRAGLGRDKTKKKKKKYRPGHFD